MAGNPKGHGTRKNERDSSYRFESAKIDGLYSVLDAVAWMEAPIVGQIAQFCGVDPRTAGKLLKNASRIGLIVKSGQGYALLVSYPYKGEVRQKQAVVREALLKMPLLVSVRQFLKLGDALEVSLRKAATVSNLLPFNAGDFAPLLEWARALEALQLEVSAEDLVDEAEEQKQTRHRDYAERKVVFLSHSSLDKPFIRQIASDLTQNGVGVWLDEQRIKVGESIPERVNQGLAESDFFLIALSKHSASSEWVKRELNGALLNEVQRRAVHILPIKLDESPIPQAIADKKYADFSVSYKAGLRDLLEAVKGSSDG